MKRRNFIKSICQTIGFVAVLQGLVPKTNYKLNKWSIYIGEEFGKQLEKTYGFSVISFWIKSKQDKEWTYISIPEKLV
jgi:hypothetical protein